MLMEVFLTIRVVGRWWLGGLVKHAKALCALCAPTVHCYRYLFQVRGKSLITVILCVGTSR